MENVIWLEVELNTRQREPMKNLSFIGNGHDVSAENQVIARRGSRPLIAGVVEVGVAVKRNVAPRASPTAFQSSA